MGKGAATEVKTFPAGRLEARPHDSAWKDSRNPFCGSELEGSTFKVLQNECNKNLKFFLDFLYTRTKSAKVLTEIPFRIKSGIWLEMAFPKYTVKSQNNY